MNQDNLNKIKLFILSKKMEKYYINLDEIADNILYKNKNKDIDCRNIIFINKCNIAKLDKANDIRFNFISEFRKYFNLKDQLQIYNMIYQHI